MLTAFKDNLDLLKEVITAYKSCLYGYEITTNAQSSQWKRPEKTRPKKAHQIRSNVKDLLIVFCDCNGVVHHEFLLQCRKVNKEHYLEVIHRLREVIRQKRTELWKNQTWILHHNNAPAHTPKLVNEFLAQNKTIFIGFGAR